MGALRALIALFAGVAIGALVVTGLLLGASRAPVQRAIPSNGDPNAAYDVGLVLTERFLREELARPASSNTAPTVVLRDPEVRLLPTGEVELRGNVTIWAIGVPARAVLLPRLVNGRLTFTVEEGQLGGFAFPGAVVAEIERRVNQRLDETMGRQPFEVVAIMPGAGTLELHLLARK